MENLPLDNRGPLYTGLKCPRLLSSVASIYSQIISYIGLHFQCTNASYRCINKGTVQRSPNIVLFIRLFNLLWALHGIRSNVQLFHKGQQFTPFQYGTQPVSPFETKIGTVAQCCSRAKLKAKLKIHKNSKKTDCNHILIR